MSRLRAVLSRLRHDTRGAQVVEFAILLPILLLLVFGIVDFGRGFFTTVILTNAAREGARAAAVGQPASTVVSRVQTALGGLYVASVETGTCTSTTVGSLCVVGTNVGGATDSMATIALTYNFKYLVLPNIMKFAKATSYPSTGVIPLTAQSSMRLE